MPSRYPKPTVLAAIRARPFATIEASAGTGKTYLLVHLIADLVLDGIPIEELLIVTFTEKATHELGRRVRTLLSTLLDASRRDEDHPDCAADEQGHRPPHWTLGIIEQARLEDALASLDRATIATIHGFCQRVLTEYAFAHGRLFKQSAVDGAALFRTVFRGALRERIAADEALTAPLRAWLAHDRSMEDLEALLRQANEAVRAGGTLGPSFDAGALARALTAFAALPDAPCTPLLTVRMNASTRRALGQRIDDLLALARRCTGSVYDFLAGLEQLERTRQVMGYLREHGDVLRQHLPSVAAAVAALDQAAVPLAAAVVAQCLAVVAGRLAEHKRDAGLFDFQDLLSLVCDRLEGPDGDRLAALLRQRYRVALIDEFQDTDSVQWRIFRRIFVDSQGRNAVYIIGDPKQAIYGFRGADVNTYLEARAHLARLGAPPHPLTANFRSTAALIEACNQIFAGDADVPFFTGGVSYSDPARPGRPGRRFVDAQGHALAPVVVLDVRPSDGDELRAAVVRARLCESIAAEIRALLAAPPRLCDGDADPGTPLTPADVYVLTRTGRESQQVGEALQAAGIPHAYFRQDKLFATEQARHVRAVLAAIDDPGDRARRFQALVSPFFALNLRDLLDDPARLDDSPEVARLHELRTLAEHRDYERLFARIIDDSGIVRRGLFLGAVDEDERSWVNVLHIFEALQGEIGRTRPPLSELVRLLDGFIAGVRTPTGEDAAEQRLQTDRQAVQVMTIHKSKGLEAKVVFLFGGFTRMGARDDIFVHHAPCPARPEHERRLLHVGAPRDETLRAAVLSELASEEERLLYVALTRAEGRLYLPYFPSAREIDATLDDRPGDLEVFERLDGGYRHVNRQLRRLLGAGATGFETRTVVCPPRFTLPAAGTTRDPSATRDEAPPLHLAADLARIEWPSTRLHRLRPQHLGPVTTSYTRLKQQGGINAANDDVASAVAVDEVQDPTPTAIVERSADPLPGGSAVGIFLHEALELAPLDKLAGAGNAATWAEDPAVAALFDRLMTRHALPAGAREKAIELVYAGLTRPLPLDREGRVTLPALHHLARPPLRESEFLYPDGGGGYVTGVIDVIFEHEGRVYGIDWKSDRLADDADLVQHTARHYGLQAELYATALARALGAGSSFAGLVYVYLRRPPGAGEVFLPAQGEA